MSEDEAMASSHGGSGGADGGMQLPEIEARLSERSVLLRIHCYSARGLLVRVISEVEQMQLSITHTNVMPFPASTAIITITAKASTSTIQRINNLITRDNNSLFYDKKFTCILSEQHNSNKNQTSDV
jgi:hypothetical protein